MEIVEYDPSRRADVADLMGRVWGARPAEAELEWFYERNPVRPASALLGEEDGRVVATVAIAFLRMSVAGAAIEVGMPLRVATDRAYQGRGIFRELEAANEERVRGLGIRLLLTVPNDASAPVFVDRLGWTALPSLRVWARPPLPRSVRPAEQSSGDRVVRDPAWLDWRFAKAPRRYEVVANGGYAVLGKRGRLGTVAATGGLLAAPRGIAIALPPPAERARYLRAGWVPTPRTFTLLGKSLDPRVPLPERPHFELGDLDFF